RRVAASTIERIHRELERAIEAASAARPVVLLIEDLHWSEPPTVALLAALTARREPARLLIIDTCRPIEAIAHRHPVVRLKPELSSKRQCIELALEGLDAEGVGAYLNQRFTQHRLPTTFAARLHAQTSGNPLFMINALDELEQRGWLREQDGAW